MVGYKAIELWYAKSVGLKGFQDLNEVEEMRNETYMSLKFSKDKLKRWHGQ